MATTIDKNRLGSGCDAGKHDENVALPVALRDDLTIPEEAALAMARILEDREHPTHTGKKMPTVDASALRERRA